MHAVDGVSLEVRRGETLGIVGESGCGKSTLGRLLVRLHEPTSGTVRFDGDRHHDALAARAPAVPPRDADDLPGPVRVAQSAQARRPDPRGPVPHPPRTARAATSASACSELLEVVGLSPDHVNRYPHEFSGGQRQRIGVARALALNPQLIVADEPVSALDVSIQAQVINLLDDLQDEFDLTYVFIAHDLGVVHHVSDRIAVMYLGVIVEIGAVGRALRAPDPPVHRGAALGDPGDRDRRRRRRRRERIVLEGEVPSPIDPPSGLPLPPALPLRDRDLPRRAARRSPTTATAASPPATTRSDAPRRRAEMSEGRMTLGRPRDLVPRRRRPRCRAATPVVICHGGPGAAHDYTRADRRALAVRPRLRPLRPARLRQERRTCPTRRPTSGRLQLFKDELVALTRRARDRRALRRRRPVVGRHARDGARARPSGRAARDRRRRLAREHPALGRGGEPAARGPAGRRAGDADAPRGRRARPTTRSTRRPCASSTTATSAASPVARLRRAQLRADGGRPDRLPHDERARASSTASAR